MPQIYGYNNILMKLYSLHIKVLQEPALSYATRAAVAVVGTEVLSGHSYTAVEEDTVSTRLSEHIAQALTCHEELVVCWCGAA